MKTKTYKDEIDLAELIINLWDNRIKIIIITISCLILGFLNFYSSEKIFLVTTNIKPISTFESQKYKLFNNLAEEVVTEEVVTEEVETEEALVKQVVAAKNLFKFTQSNLLNLFINKIQTEELLEKAIIKFQLVNKDYFKNEDDYKAEIKRTAISIIDEMIPPLNDEEGKSRKVSYWKFNFKVIDIETWINFLEYVEKEANEEIRLSLISSFNKEIEGLNINLKFKLEDIEQQLANAMNDYKISVKNRVEFLTEQAEIARVLNIKNNTLETSSFQFDNNIITNIKSESSYYLKGYEVIEKEMSLIKTRKNVKAFIPSLIELEQTKRSILQDKKIERLKFLFSETPVKNKNFFSAAKIDYVATAYISQKSLPKVIAISVLIGLLISFIYIFLTNLKGSLK